MIPDEAVEAAAKAAYEVQPVELFGEDGPVTWEQLGGSILGNSRKWHEIERAKAALEAAAPHLMAAAWEEGFDKGFYDPKAGSYWDASESTATNPYRKAGA